MLDKTDAIINNDDTSNQKSFDRSKVDTALYWYSVTMGYSVLGAWNAIATCMDYFVVLYRPYGYYPEFTLPLANFLPLVGCQFFIIGYGEKISPGIKVVFSTAMLGLSMFIMILFCKIITNMALNFAIAVIVSLVVGLFNGVTQSAVGGLVGMMGGEGKYIVGNMIGNGISGILSNVIEFACLLIIGHEKEDQFKSTMLFFIITGATMIVCTYISYLMIENPITKKIIEITSHGESLKKILRLTWPVFKGQGKNVFILYIMTFLIFPGLFIAQPLSFVPSQWSVPVMMFIFNIFDTIGRFLPNYYVLLSSKGTTYLCMLRVFSIILMFFVGYGMFNKFFVNDGWIIVSNIIFSFTNGLGTSLTMMHGVNEAEDRDKENAGEVMILLMTSGLCLGSIIAQLILVQFL